MKRLIFTILVGILLSIGSSPSFAKKCKIKTEKDGVQTTKPFQVAKGKHDHSTFRYLKKDGQVELESSLLLTGKLGRGETVFTTDTLIRLVSETESLTLQPSTEGSKVRPPIIGIGVTLLFGNKQTRTYYSISPEAVEWILTHPVIAFEIEFINDGQLIEKIYPTKEKQKESFVHFTKCIDSAA